MLITYMRMCSYIKERGEESGGPRAERPVPGNGGGSLKAVQSLGRSDADPDSLSAVPGGMLGDPGGGDAGFVPVRRFPPIVPDAHPAAREIPPGGAHLLLLLR